MKNWLVLAVAAGALTANVASGQHPTGGPVTCVSSAVPALVRAEGVAELLGDILLQCAPPASGGLSAKILVNLSITLNTNVTNNIDFGQGPAVMDAVLIVNGNTSGGPTAAATSAGNGQLPQYGTKASDNTVAWTAVNVPVPGVGGNPPVTTLRFTNIRGNVCTLAAGGLNIPFLQVTAYVSASGPTNLAVTNNVLNVGTPRTGVYAGVGGVVLQQCRGGQNLDSDGNLIPIAVSDHDSGNPTFYATFTEGFATAFKTLGTPTSVPTAFHGEDGYPTPGSGVNGGGASSGTRFLIRFFNVPAGIRVFTPLSIAGSTTTNGNANVTLRIVKLAGATAQGTGGFAAGASLEVAITNGFGFVVYEVVEDNPFAEESVSVPVVVAFRADLVNQLSVPTMQASATVAPVSDVIKADRDAPEPRFCDTSAPTAAVVFQACRTNLLFPFVTNLAGFDTGLAIANTSADDKGTAPQGGPCTLFYFGSTTGGGAAPASQTTTPIAGGSTLTWTLTAGNPQYNLAGTPGFQGYIFAQCRFLFAHGFAFITDGFGGVPRTGEGYLALVVPWDGSAGTRSGEGSVVEVLTH